MTLPSVPRRTTPAFGFKYVERSLEDCLRKREFGRNEMRKVVEFFEQWERQPTCAYCGISDVSRWDHIVPVMSGGATMSGNMVLACSTCDNSKGRLGLYEWMQSDAPKAPKRRGVANRLGRIERIRAYVEHHAYRSEPLEDGLSGDEVQRLRAIRERLDSLRQEVDSLVVDFRMRTGYQ